MTEPEKTIPETPSAAAVWARDVGLLLLRLVAGGLLLGSHGVSKIGTLIAGGDFPDPIGVGQTLSLLLAIFGEFICPIFVVIGALTRVLSVPPLITMLVATLIVHAGQPLGQRELAIMYALPFAVLLLTGPGRLSLDVVLMRKLDAWRKGDRSKQLHVR